MRVADQIRDRSDELTTAERRVAEVVVSAPQTVGFGTVADLAAAAGAGAATVVRLATKLGFDGFTGLQSAVQNELMNQLRPAAERIREAAGEGIIARHGATEVANVRATLDGVDDATFSAVIARLADLKQAVHVVSGDASAGIAAHFVAQLELLRPGVELVGGNDVAVRRQVALATRGSTLVVIDLRRYDRWVLDALALAHERGLWVVALTDSILAPLASGAEATLVLSADAVGPFDSHVGTLALLELIVAEVAARLRTSATGRLDAVERAWQDGTSLTDL